MSSADDFVCPDCDDPEPHKRGDCPFYETSNPEFAEHYARRARLAAQYGMPEHISNADALALARTAHVAISPYVTADDWIYASIYRDEAAADGWLASNLEHNGYPALAKVPLPDGRVVGILDLRAAYRAEVEKARKRAEEDALAGATADAADWERAR